jgi:hypothetical protein
MDYIVICQQALQKATVTLDPILGPTGFTFAFDDQGRASGGDFASGFYIKGDTKIGLIYRASSGLGMVIYEHGRASVGHHDLMKSLGHQHDCRLTYDEKRYVPYSRDGSDLIDALAHDLKHFVIDILARDQARFEMILSDAFNERLKRQGFRP